MRLYDARAGQRCPGGGWRVSPSYAGCAWSRSCGPVRSMPIHAGWRTASPLGWPRQVRVVARPASASTGPLRRRMQGVRRGRRRVAPPLVRMASAALASPCEMAATSGPVTGRGTVRRAPSGNASVTDSGWAGAGRRSGGWAMPGDGTRRAHGQPVVDQSGGRGFSPRRPWPTRDHAAAGGLVHGLSAWDFDDMDAPPPGAARMNEAGRKPPGKCRKGPGVARLWRHGRSGTAGGRSALGESMQT